MKTTTDINIYIPAAIAALPNLDLIERVVLARVYEQPVIHNADLAALTGLSLRRVENTLTRLRERDLIQVTGKGRARRLWITFYMEHTRNVGDENGNAAPPSTHDSN